MKLGLFADPHYSSAPVTCGKRFNNQSLRKIREAMAYFEREGCDRAICLGDLTDREETREMEEENLRAIGEILGQVSFPVFCLMGNHDAFTFEEKRFYEILGEQFRPRPMQEGDVTLLFLDACYFSDGRRYGPGDSNWEDSFFPFETELAENLKGCKGEIYLFSHQNLDPEIPLNHVISNAGSIRRLLEGFPSVRTVYQGHYHPGHEMELHGIRYVTLPAMCEGEGAWRVIPL